MKGALCGSGCKAFGGDTSFAGLGAFGFEPGVQHQHGRAYMAIGLGRESPLTPPHCKLPQKLEHQYPRTLRGFLMRIPALIVHEPCSNFLEVL